MAGDPNNASVWADADVYVSFDLNAADPTDIDTDFGPDWDLVGCLDGSTGFNEDRSMNETDHSAWGFGVIETSYTGQVLTRSFTALEWNDTVRRLAYPGSAGSTLKFGKPERVRIAFETSTGGKKRRVISKSYARCTTGTIQINEENLEQHPFTAKIFPDDEGHWTIQEAGSASS